MANLISLAGVILRNKREVINSTSLDVMAEELKCCLKGRKVQILILLEKETRMTSGELVEAMKLTSRNIAGPANRLVDSLLIEKYDGTRFQSDETLDLRPMYHSITDIGRELIADLGK